MPAWSGVSNALREGSIRVVLQKLSDYRRYFQTTEDIEAAYDS
jgi:hypothetical protein